MVSYLLRDYFGEAAPLRDALAVAFSPGIAGQSATGAGGGPIGARLVWCTATEDAEPGDTMIGQYGEIGSCNPMAWNEEGAAPPLTLGVDGSGSPVLYEAAII